MPRHGLNTRANLCGGHLIHDSCLTATAVTQLGRARTLHPPWGVATHNVQSSCVATHASMHGYPWKGSLRSLMMILACKPTRSDWLTETVSQSLSIPASRPDCLPDINEKEHRHRDGHSNKCCLRHTVRILGREATAKVPMDAVLPPMAIRSDRLVTTLLEVQLRRLIVRPRLLHACIHDC